MFGLTFQKVFLESGIKVKNFYNAKIFFFSVFESNCLFIYLGNGPSEKLLIAKQDQDIWNANFKVFQLVDKHKGGQEAKLVRVFGLWNFDVRFFEVSYHKI
jgi:hypothetical protein